MSFPRSALSILMSLQPLRVHEGASRCGNTAAPRNRGCEGPRSRPAGSSGLASERRDRPDRRSRLPEVPQDDAPRDSCHGGSPPGAAYLQRRAERGFGRDEPLQRVAWDDERSLCLRPRRWPRVVSEFGAARAGVRGKPRSCRSRAPWRHVSGRPFRSGFLPFVTRQLRRDTRRFGSFGVLDRRDQKDNLAPDLRPSRQRGTYLFHGAAQELFMQLGELSGDSDRLRIRRRRPKRR